MAETLSLFSLAFDIEAVHAEHRLWLESEGRRGRRAHFRRSDLTAVNLSGYQFAGASLRGCIIRDVNFSGADLSGCDMVEAVLENVNLQGALLHSAIIKRAHLYNVEFEAADLSDADFAESAASEVSFAGARMVRASLRDAVVQGADFSNVQMQEAILRGADCTGARFDYADLSGADCRSTIFDYGSFSHTIVTDAHFKGASLKAIHLSAVDFSRAFEVTFDLQTQVVMEERLRLEREQKQLVAERIQLDEMGQRLSAAKKRMDERETTFAANKIFFDQAVDFMKWVAVVYGIMCILWLGISSILLHLTFSRLSQIGIDRISGIVAGVGLVLILSFLSLFFALKTRSILLKITEQKSNVTQEKDAAVAANNGIIH